MIALHHARLEDGCNGGSITCHIHSVDPLRRVNNLAKTTHIDTAFLVIANQNGIIHQVLLHKTAQQGCTFFIFQLTATAFTKNLHIDTCTRHADKLIPCCIGGLALIDKGSLVNNLYPLAGNEVTDGILFLFFHVGIGLIVITTGKGNQTKHEE